MYAPPCSWRTGTNSTDESASDSFRSSVSSPGMPKTCFTPSASRHSTKTSDALRTAICLDSTVVRMRRRAALLTVLLSLLLPASAAAGTTTWVMNGAGFGHGIGISLYGAWGFARHGWNYDQILAWYYKGTRISSAPRGSVRVLLATGRSSIQVSDVKQVGTRRLDPRETYTAKASGGGVTLRDSHGKTAGHTGGPAQVWDAGHGVRLGGRAYRGAIELRAGSGGLAAINLVGLDDYVKGVVPGEMPSLWSP